VLSWAAALLLAAGMTALTTACERRARTAADEADTTAAEGPTPRQVSYDATFRLYRGGEPRSTLIAERMEQYETEDSTYTLLRSPSDSLRARVYVFDENGDSSATITADRVYLFQKENRFEAYGNVVVVTTDDKTLRSEHLTWNEADRKLRTRRFVRIRTPTERVQGTGLVADEDLDTYSIGRFTARVEVDDEEENAEEGEAGEQSEPSRTPLPTDTTREE
jgi:LPS export ABC transporter protein LptC